MVLGFKKQFVRPIQKGSKIHTIRLDEKKRWKKGRIIHFATGVRTSKYKQFKADECKSVQEISFIRCKTIENYWDDSIIVDGKALNTKQKEWLAFNDGFESLEDLLNWFVPIPRNEVKGIESTTITCAARIIHWTNFRY